MTPFITNPVTTVGAAFASAVAAHPAYKTAPMWNTAGRKPDGAKSSSGSSSPTSSSVVPSLAKKMMVNQSVRNIPNPSLLTKQKNGGGGGAELAPQKTVT